jgi:hypothetical protein
MKRFISILLLTCCPAALMAAEAVVITPGQTVIVQTSAGPATGVVLPAADGQSYLVLSLSVPGGNLAIPFVVAPYGTVPTPGPGPSPDPGPGPTPVPSGKLFVLIVTETAQQTPQQAAVINSKAADEYIAAKSWQRRVADKDTVDENGKVPTDLAAWLDKAKAWNAGGGKWPYLNIADGSGAVVYEGAMPATEAEYLALLKKFGG